MRSLFQGLQRSLPKPCLFGLYGALGGLLGALLMGELLWFLLSPAIASGGPPLQLAVSENVSVYQGGKNRCMVTLGRTGFEGEVKVQLVSPPSGIEAVSITIPKNKMEGQLEIGVGPDVELGTNTLKVRATSEGNPDATAEATIQLKVLKVEPALRIAASPAIVVAQGGKANRFTVRLARDRFDGPVKVRVRAGLPANVTIPEITIPQPELSAEMEVQAGAGAEIKDSRIDLIATGPDEKLLRDEASIKLSVKPRSGTPQVDVLFVLDVTGSMSKQIKGVRDGFLNLVKEMEDKKFDSRIGLIAYRDHKSEKEEPELPKFDGSLFTRDYAAFRREVNKLRATGGGDEPESTLDAVTLAARQDFRPKANKVMILITDATPHIPDRDTRTIKEAVDVLQDKKIDQLHTVVKMDHQNLFYAALQKGAKEGGKWFDIDKTVGADGGKRFSDELLPELSKAISEAVIKAAPPEDLSGSSIPDAPRTKSAASLPESQAPPGIKAVGSTQRYAAGSAGRLIAAWAIWTAVIAAAICLFLIAGQYFYLRQVLVPPVQAVKGLAGGVLAGLLGGAIAQVLFQVTGNLFNLTPGGAGDKIVEAFFRILGWTVLGSLAGLGLAFFVPNLRAAKGLLGGAIGGAIGAVGFIAVNEAMHFTVENLLGAGLVNFVARMLGAVLLGACIGLMVAIAERAFRTAWLEVRYGREVRTVNLGPEPVSIGSNAQDCTIYARNAPPVAFRYWARNGKISREDATTGHVAEVKPGEEHPVGVLVVAVCAAGAADAVPANVRPQGAAPAAVPPPPANQAVRLSPSIGRPGGPPPARPAGPTPIAGAPPAASVPPRPQPIVPAPQPTAAAPRPAPVQPAPAAPAGGQAAPAANNCPRCGFKAPPGPVGKRYCMVCDKSF